MIQKPSRGHYNVCIFIAQMNASHSSAPESNKQNPRDRTLDLSIFFRYKHIPSLKNLPSPAPNESSPYWFHGNFAASFVFNFCLREFLLSAFANRFELRCEPKRLMLLYYKLCPCYFKQIQKNFNPTAINMQRISLTHVTLHFFIVLREESDALINVLGPFQSFCNYKIFATFNLPIFQVLVR